MFGIGAPQRIIHKEFLSLRPLAEELRIKAGKLFSPLRVALTGRIAAPPLFETMAVLGRERCLRRIKVAVERLGNSL